MQDLSRKRYECRKHIKSVRWLIFWVVLARFAAQVLLAACLSFSEKVPHEYVRSAIIEVLAVGVPIVVYARSLRRDLKGENPKTELSFNKTSFWLLLISVLIGFSGQFVMMLLNIPANLFITEVLKKDSVDAIPLAMNISELALGFLTMAVIPAVLEEFWLRGIVFGAYNRGSTVAAAVFTTLIFALVHNSVSNFLGFLFMGAYLAAVLIKTRSVYAAMLCHAANNAAALLFGFMLTGLLERLTAVFILAAVVFAVSIWLLFKFGTKPEVVKEMKAGKLIFGSIFSLPVVLSVVVEVLRYFMFK